MSRKKNYEASKGIRIQGGKYCVTFTVEHVNYYLGTYDNLEEAEALLAQAKEEVASGRNPQLLIEAPVRRQIADWVEESELDLVLKQSQYKELCDFIIKMYRKGYKKSQNAKRYKKVKESEKNSEAIH